MGPRRSAPASGGPAPREPEPDPVRDAAQRRAVLALVGPLDAGPLEAVRLARGRAFQRLEFVGDSVLEVVIHAHAVIVGPGCPHCAGRADHFTTDAHLTELARALSLGDWLTWHPSDQRLADLVEACAGAAWASGHWPRLVGFTAARLHPLPSTEQRRLLHGGAHAHPDAPVRAREILGAAILEAAASTAAFTGHPDGDAGDLSRVRSRMLATEHVMTRVRDSRWVHRSLRTRHVVRDDVEALLADVLLARGIAAAVSVAWPLTT